MMAKAGTSSEVTAPGELRGQQSNEDRSKTEAGAALWGGTALSLNV